jgi:hypothetical protein
MDHLESRQGFPFSISYLIYYTTGSTAHVFQTLTHNSEVVTETGGEEERIMEDEVRKNKRLGQGGKRKGETYFSSYFTQFKEFNFHSSSLKLEVACSSRMLVLVYQTTRCYLT